MPDGAFAEIQKAGTMVRQSTWQDAVFLRLNTPLICAQALEPDKSGIGMDAVEVRIECIAPHLLQDFPDLTTRIRGAWGPHLKQMETDHPRGGGVSAGLSLYSLFFDPLPNCVGIRQSVPRPFLLSADVEGRKLQVKLTLLGFIRSWCDLAARSLVRALEVGIKLSAQSATRTRVTVRSVEAELMHFPLMLKKVPSGREVRVSFEGVARFRKGQATRLSASSFLNSAMDRVRGLWRWQDTDIRLDWDDLALQTRDVRVTDYDLNHLAWKRFSRRMRGVPIPMTGFTGSITLAGMSSELAGLVETCLPFGVGSHTALGFGRYQLYA